MFGVKKIARKAKSARTGTHRMPKVQPEGYAWKLEFDDPKSDPRKHYALEGATPTPGSSRPTGMPVGTKTYNASKHATGHEQNATATQIIPRVRVNPLVVSDLGMSPTKEALIGRAAFNLLHGGRGEEATKSNIASIIAGFEEHLRREAEAYEEAHRMVPDTWLAPITFPALT